MKTQTRTLFSVLALLLAAGTCGIASAQNAPTESQTPPAAASQAPPATQGSATAPAQGNNTILNMKAGEISGREVYNTQGKELGKVDMIGRDRNTGDLSAVVSVGGFLGFGGSKVAIPIDQLSLQNDKLILSTAMSKKELRKQASNYQSKRYEGVAEDTTLSQVAPATGGASAATAPTRPQAGASAPPSGTGAPQAQGQAPSTGGTVSFEQLDANRDGYIERSEAAKDPALLNRWQQADRNHDGRIDQSEFSAFEQSSGQATEPRPSGDNMRERQRARPMPSQR